MVILKKGQHLSDVMTEIPTDCILSKRIPGCGATTLELKANRSSIIIVPNVPVINSKESDTVLGVYEDVSVLDIVTYLKENKQFKILVTPESFRKVKKACEQCGINIHTDCFMLMDECHQLIKDVNFRNSITSPLMDFFHFNNKALVSATPLVFSDPRLKKFETIEVHADYDYQQDIDVIYTDNTTKALSEYLENHKDGKVCIYYNSIDGIYSIIKHFGLTEQSATVYCAGDSIDKLKLEYGFSNVFMDWSADTMKRVNFFTSRFFCAFDLVLLTNPDLLMITDPYVSETSILDVDTDCIQICGRFRKGLKSVTHIYRVNPKLSLKSEEQIRQDIRDLEIGYNTLRTHYENAETKEDRLAFGQPLETHPYINYLTPYDHTKNWYKIDCEVYEGLVHSRYSSKRKIEEWYDQCHYFTPHFKECISNEYDKKMEIVRSARTERDRRKKMVDILSKIEQPYSENARNFISMMRKMDSLIVNAYETLGKEKIVELNYNQREIKEKMILKERKGNRAIRLIKNSFVIGVSYSNEDIVNELTRIYDKLGIKPERTIKGSMIKDYYKVVGWKNKEKRGYKPISAII